MIMDEKLVEVELNELQRLLIKRKRLINRIKKCRNESKRELFIVRLQSVEKLLKVALHIE